MMIRIRLARGDIGKIVVDGPFVAFVERGEDWPTATATPDPAERRRIAAALTEGYDGASDPWWADRGALVVIAEAFVNHVGSDAGRLTRRMLDKPWNYSAEYAHAIGAGHEASACVLCNYGKASP